MPFRLTGCQEVLFEDELVSACALLQRDDVSGIAAHVAVRDSAGNLLSVRADPASPFPRFFVPDAEEASAPLDMVTKAKPRERPVSLLGRITSTTWPNCEK